MLRLLKRLFRPDAPIYRPNPAFQQGRVMRVDQPWFHNPNDFKTLKEKKDASQTNFHLANDYAEELKCSNQ